MNLTELKEFIDELNEQLLHTKQDFSRPSMNIVKIFSNEEFKQENQQQKQLSETEAKVYVKISHYFRLVTITIPNLTVAYEIWLKGALQVLLDEVGLTGENWDEICNIGDHNSLLLERIDDTWQDFLGEVRQGNINNEVWELIQKGKSRSKELINRRIVRKKRLT